MQKLFLVDDSPLVRSRLAEMLAGLPEIELVDEAGDVQEAINPILEVQPDVVLLDLSIESGSGFDVLKAIHGREPDIHLYLLSNFASPPYRRHAERLGARGFFDKAGEFERLRDTLKGENGCPPSSP